MSTTTSRVIVPARYLVALENFQSDETTRFYLRGIHIKPHADGAMMAATNGHIMGNLLARGAIVEGEPRIWAVKAKKLLSPVIRAHEAKDMRLWCDMTFADGKVAVSLLLVSGKTDEPVNPLVAGAEIATLSAADAASVIDGTFPDCDRLWRASKWNPEGTASKAFSPIVLKDLLAFSAALDAPRKQIGAFRCWHTGDADDNKSPSLVTFSGTPDACVMMMPLTDTEHSPDMIGWLRDILGHNENWVAKALDEKKAA